MQPLSTPESSPPRRIRSFVRREGRLTSAQQQALDCHWHRFGVSTRAEPLDLDALFGRAAPRCLEIGFGNGDTLLHLATADPGTDFLGIEVHRPGVGHLLLRLAEADLDNVRVFCADATEVLARQIPPASLQRILVFFPDPWPKKRHHKRRLIQPALLSLLASRLESGGIVHLCTDWEPYAEHMLATFEASADFINLAEQAFVPHPPERPLTRFEQRGQRLGHRTRDLMFHRL